MAEPLINPYDTRGMVREASQFFGRSRELREVFGRLATMQSVSVVGERRIGKSSFLHRLTRPQNGDLPPGIVIKYLDLQRVFSGAEFYARACKLFNHEIKHDEGNYHLDFEEALAAQESRVVLCLDEFEQAYHKDFGDEFFNALRSYAQEGNLALVVATQTPLNELHALYLRDQDVTSKFHNIFAQVSLGELTDAEAREMVTEPRGEFSFTPQEASEILRLAGNHPYWLNTVCSEVYVARQNGTVDFIRIADKLNRARISSQPKALADVTTPAYASSSAPPPPVATLRDENALVRWGLRLGLAGVIIGALSGLSGLAVGVYLSFTMIAIALGFLLKSFSWRGGTV